MPLLLPRSANEYYGLKRLLVQRGQARALAARRRGSRAAAHVVIEHQYAGARLAQRGFGRMLSEQDIDTRARALLDDQAFTTEVQRLLRSLDGASTEFEFNLRVGHHITDAASAVEGALVDLTPAVTGWVRHLVLPSCSRCAILAGRQYRWSAGFQRHPNCDCIHVPTGDSSPVDDMVVDVDEAIASGQVTGLSKADLQAWHDGVPANQIVNIRRGQAGLTVAGEVLERVGRLTPAGIANQAGDDRDARVEAYRENGYTRESVARSNSAGGGSSQPPRDATPAGGDDDWRARQAALEGEFFTANGQSLEPAEIEFVERMVRLRQRLEWIPTGSNGNDSIGTLPTNDFKWHTLQVAPGLEVEHKALLATTEITSKSISSQIRKASNKNARRHIVTAVIVDVGARDIPEEVIAGVATFNLRHPDRIPIQRLWLMSHGKLRFIPLRK